MRAAASHSVNAAPSPAAPTVVILGLAGLTRHHGALGAIRSAGRLGVAVRHVPRVPGSPLDRSRYARGGAALPSDADDAQKLEALMSCRGDGQRAILLPVDDISAAFVEDRRAALSEAFVFPSQPAGLVRALIDKRAMHELCAEHGVPTAAAWFPQSHGDVLGLADRVAFPIVLKRIDATLPAQPADGRSLPAVPNVLVARSRAELLAAHARLESPAAPNVMIEEYVPATPGGDWMFNGYFDSDGRCRAAFTGQKLRQAPPGAGAASLGVARVNPALARSSERLLGAVGYRGVVDADYRLDRRDGRYKLLDVNPRIGASFRTFVAADGTDVLRAMLRDLASREPSAPRPAARAPGIARQQEGRRWLVEPQDLMCALATMRDGELAARDWVGSLRGVRELAWWARDDPAPFVAISRALLVRRVRR